MITYELKQVRSDREPVIGEIRFKFVLVPMPGEELASMIQSGPPVMIIWNGEQWSEVVR
jgi:hypothetical protein